MLVWLRHFQGRHFFSRFTVAQVISPEVMQLTFGMWSVQGKVDLEIPVITSCITAPAPLQLLYQKFELRAVYIKHYLEYVAWGEEGCAFDRIIRSIFHNSVSQIRYEKDIIVPL